MPLVSLDISGRPPRHLSDPRLPQPADTRLPVSYRVTDAVEIRRSPRGDDIERQFDRD
jgi:hypothetical protein